MRTTTEPRAQDAATPVSEIATAGAAEISGTDPAFAPVFVDDETGAPVEGADQDETPTPEDLFPGNILTVRHDSRKRHYRIVAVQAGTPPGADEAAQGPVVRLTPARSQLSKGFLLLALLAASWFAVKYAIALLGALAAG
ncbi:MAG: hypothetical protein H0S85_01805 [Desulfovibrionaceae bacterium]|jgi:hypothetical protein|nr:hypothetical protein [Desulfovibrionaceae bacterium]